MFVCSACWNVIGRYVSAEPPQVSQIHVLENVEVPVYEGTWVTVFGFTPESSVISAVLQDFQTCGNIQMWISPPTSTCNWIYIQFESKQAAQRALQRNGSTLGVLGIRIGVQPASYQDRQHIASQASSSWSSAGVEPALPERHYALATTAAKVQSPAFYQHAVHVLGPTVPPG